MTGSAQMLKSLAIRDLVDGAWRAYRATEAEDFIVSPSIPILFNGDSERYFQSQRKVITVGLNPSHLEFPDSDRFARFPGARNISPEDPVASFQDEYMGALTGYFRTAPYRMWFDPFEKVLEGMGCSYYDFAPNAALHTDLCSQLATYPTWSRLSQDQRTVLEHEGTRRWHCLLEYLQPDVVIISVARRQLAKISFPWIEDWSTLYTFQRENRYEVDCSRMRINGSHCATVVFLRAAELPFGSVSKEDRRAIGAAIGRQVYGD